MKSVKHSLLPAGLFLLLLIAFSIPGLTQQGVLTKRPNVAINANVNGFLEYVPFGYNASTERYPLIIYINGIGSTGNGSEAALENHFTGGGYPHEQQRDGSWVDAYTVNGQTFRFVIITPQFITPMHQKIPTAGEVNDVLSYAIQNYRVDTSRIYVVGQSQGGGAVWDYPGTSSGFARRVAAIVPFSGVSYPIEAKSNNIKFNNVAVWAFHNFFDAQVPSYFTADYVDMINQSPPPAIVARKTMPVAYNGDGTPNPEHNSWYRWLRREVTDNGMDIYEWMLLHKKTSSTAFAGLFQEITLPVNSVQLSGSGNGPNGTAASYSWQKLSGPGGGSVSNSNAANATASGMTKGSYVYQLTITDNGGGTATSTVNVLVNPPTARIQAEDYANMNGIRTENTEDEGGGVHVGYIDQGDWMEYGVNVPAAGNYKFRFRYGSFISGARFRVLTSGGVALDTIEVFDTGGWQRFLTRTVTLPLVAGQQTLRFESIASAGWNFNWFEVESASSSAPPVNQAPSAAAGPDLSIRLPVNSVQLNGSGTDPDGTIVSYAWTKVSGPAGGTITSPTQAATTVTGLTTQGSYTFRLTVTDNGGATGTDDVMITVSANSVPTAFAGNDQSIKLPLNSVQLNGSGTDPDGTIASYAWTKASGPTDGTITSPGQAATTVTGLTQGVYVFRLTVTDNGGATALDDVTVTVNANGVPTANAGPDQAITLPLSSVQLSGSGTDADGSITAYAWTKVSGPAGGTITSSSQAATSVTALTQGTYVFRLTVTDNGGAIATDDMTVTVNANGVPTANAGPDQAITLPLSSVQLSGSGTDADGSITAYAWTKVSGPAGGTITSSSQAATSVTALTQGTYVFRLTVTDNGGATATDDMTVTVNANGVPTANAGADQSIKLPVSSVQLSGSGTDPNGSITAYAWSKVSGPAGGTITSPTQAATTVTGLTTQGSYVFRLTVTDDGGATGTDDVTITVSANSIPTAFAGNDQSIKLPLNSVQLNGSGTDPDGTIASYAWTKASGPTDGTITSPGQAATTVTGLTQGVYVFRLTVTDNGGATALDDVTVTVNANGVPTANAGPDQAITLPLSSVQLSGSGTDADGSITAYAWTKVSGPAGGSITSSSQAATSVTALTQGTYVFRLTVTDNGGATATDDMTVTVNANGVPTANAGADQSIKLPVSSVQLSGSGTDPNGSITAYAWSKVSGPAGGTITSPTQAATTVTGLTTQGSYVFRLTVTDDGGATGTDDVTITVSANSIPTAFAGNDQSIKLPLNSVQLNGSGTDPDGTIASYAWTKASGPTDGTITSPGQAATTVTGLTQGVYVFRLTVTDNGGATALDDVTVTVNANGVPTANAGPDQAITLPLSSVQLSGSGTDADGSITAYAWTKVSGPAGGTIVSANQPSTGVNGLEQGTYVFRLAVTDNGGASATDDVTITVSAAPPTGTTNHQAYIATTSTGTQNFGGELGMEFKVLHPGGIIVNQLGVFDHQGNGITGTQSGGIRVAIFNKASKTIISGLDVTISGNGDAYSGNHRMRNVAPVTLPPGDYMVVTKGYNAGELNGNSEGRTQFPTGDLGGGAIAYAGTGAYGMENGFTYPSNPDGGPGNRYLAGTFRYAKTGGTPANTPPTATAGADQTITLPASSVQLSGSGSDGDGSIVSYTWTKVSGPAGGSIASPGQPATEVSGLTQGTYIFRLTVTDNGGATATDDVSITVNSATPPPPSGGTTTHIEAEHYVNMLGIQTESTSDIGGGLNVGYIDNGDWMDYTYNAPVAGTYTIHFRVATPNSGARFQVRTSNGSVLATVNVPVTGGWYQDWMTISTTVTLAAGQQTIRLQSTASDPWNINWLEITSPNGVTPPPPPPPPPPSGGTTTHIEAEHYVNMLGIQTESTSDIGGGLNVGYIDNGDWMDYTYNAPVAGTYTIHFRVATPNSGARFQVRTSNGSVLATVNVPVTGGWYQDWMTISTTVTLAAGQQTIRLQSTASDPWNINWLEITSPNGVTPPPPPPPPPPSGGTTTHIEAEHYVNMLGIQTESTSDIGGGLNVGYIDNGDWMDYTYNAPVAGTYTIHFRVATPNSGARFQVRTSNGSVLATVNVPVTGGWYQDWMTISTTVTLAAGQQTIRLQSTASDPWNINWLEITSPAAGTNTVYGTQKASKSAEVDEAGAGVIAVYPNPVSDVFNVQVQNNYSGKVQVQVIGMNGMVYRESRFVKSGGRATMRIDGRTLAQGKYVVHVIMKNQRMRTTFIKL